MAPGQSRAVLAGRLAYQALILLLAAAQAFAGVEAAWPTYHGGFDLAGASAAAAPAKPVVLWRFRADGAIGQTPAIADGRAFFTTEKGTVYAVTMAGTQAWRRTLGTTNAPVTFTAPLLALPKTLILGADDGRLFALDAAEGRTRWEYAVGDSLQGSPNAVAPAGSNDWTVVAVAQPDGVIHGVDLRTGRPVWKSPATSRCDGSPAVGAGRIVYGNCDAALYIFSAADGRRLASLPLGEDSQVAGGVAIAGQRAYSGSRSGKIVCADLGEPRIVWANTNSTGEVFTTPAVARGLVVIASSDSRLYALDAATGATAWTFEAGRVVRSPVIAGDNVVLAADGKLRLLSLARGEVLWSRDVSDVITAPALAAGIILVGADDGTLTAFGSAPQ